MKKIILALILFLAVAALGIWLWYNYFKMNNVGNLPPISPAASTTPMRIISPAFLEGQNIPTKYTCNGDGVNPPLIIAGVPEGAKSLVLIVDDPDAPNGTWTHWTLWNISASTTSIAENSAPEGATQGQTSFGQNVYGGPCPPSGLHHYHFKLYALDSKITLPSYSQVEDLNKAISGRIINQAELVGVYAK